MVENKNTTNVEIYEDDIIKVTEKVDVYRKTPLIRTAAIGSILYEAGNMFYHFIAQKNSITSYVNENVNFFNNTLVPTIRDISNYAYENTGLSVLIAGGVGYGWFLFEKARSYKPEKTIKEIPSDSKQLDAVKEINYELDKKHYFIEDKIKYYSNKYVKPFVYGFMGLTAGISTIGGTYGSFIKNGLNAFKNFPQVADSYSAFLLTAGAGIGFFSLRKFSEYAVNIGRGFYERYLYVDNKINSLNEEQKVSYESAEKEERVKILEGINKLPKSEQVKVLENLIRNKKSRKKIETNKN